MADMVSNWNRVLGGPPAAPAEGWLPYTSAPPSGAKMGWPAAGLKCQMGTGCQAVKKISHVQHGVNFITRNQSGVIVTTVSAVLTVVPMLLI